MDETRMDVEETVSARGNPLFRVNDFLYEVDKRKAGKFFCRCIRKRSDFCAARAIIVKDPELKLLKMDKQHNHEGERRDRIVRTARQNMKKAALSRPDKSIKQVYNEVLAETVRELQASHDLEELEAALPGFSGFRSTIQRTRAKVRPPSIGLPTDVPSSLDQLTLDGEWTKTTDGEDFLLFNDGTENRILGFGTHECIRMVCGAPSVYMDGTFGVVPVPFQQLYTIHTFYKGQMMPLVFFLLPDRGKQTYTRVFSLLKSYSQTVGLLFQPKKMQCDFAVEAKEAIEESFPAAQLKGCNFHFCQAVWRKVEQLGLTTFYEDSAVKRFLKSVIALSLVPLERLDEAWAGISSDSANEGSTAHQALEHFKEYFKTTWLENESVFPRSLWNRYSDFGPRTTDHIEGWHRAFNKEVRKTHVNIYEMITHLKKEEKRLKLQRVLLNMKLPPSNMREKYRTLGEKLPRLVDQLESEEISLIEYVRRVAYLLPSDQLLVSK